LAVTTTVAAVVAGMVKSAVKEPLAAVVNGMLDEPAASVPEDWRAKPLPFTVMDAPAGPAVALKAIPALPAASDGTARPNTTASDVTTPDSTSRNNRFLRTNAPQHR
jgi:hypothetical protein